MNNAHKNVDPAEVQKFDDLASRWWDPQGEFKPLHQLNPVRFDYVDERAAVTGKKCLDVGCGGGLLTEALATKADSVTGIDMAEGPLQVARLHQKKSALDNIRYLQSSAEQLAEQESGQYDLVSCMEVIEHVPDPASLVAACASLCKPGGDVFFSTINRNFKAFLTAIIGAEYVMRMLPRGTHDYERFIKPSELRRWGDSAGLEFIHVAGLTYAPVSGRFSITNDVDVNYLMHFRVPA
ncbi:MAG: bifunctional 2-polyprenyl-6-hydroxyphenol methylase/3-demethylubiquinol 3-O-methyltransferase UbiG [Gammaproteobacteria bacterium]